MKNLLMLCVPGPWKDWGDFANRICTAGTWTGLSFEFTLTQESILQSSKGRSVGFTFQPHFPNLANSLEAAGDEKLPASLLDHVANHNSLVYLIFEGSFLQEREAILDFGRLLRSIGGIAVKVESSGTVHEWNAWEASIHSPEPSEWYRALVTLNEDQFYYSRGMQHFGLPDVEISRVLSRHESSNLVTRFNLAQITGESKVEPGDPLSPLEKVGRFQFKRLSDYRHRSSNPLHNPNGLWRLEC